MSTMSRAVSARRLMPALAAFAIPALTPVAVTSQLPVALRLRAFAGVVDARGDLPNAPILSSPNNVISYGALAAVPAVGMSVEGRVPTFPVSLRLSIGRSLGGDELGVWGCAPDPNGQPTVCPDIFIQVPTDVTTTLGTADAVVDVSLGPITLRPSAGLGWWRQSYSWDPSPVGSFSLEPGRYRDNALALHLGFGVAAPIGGVTLEAESGVYAAPSELTRPNRLGILLIGVTVPLT